MKWKSVKTAVMNIAFLANAFITYSQSNYIFKNPTLISGTALQVNAVYRFSNVKTGIDARVTISAITGGISLTNIDGGGGFDRALQPVLNVPGNKNGYVELTIRFYTAGTTTLNSQSEVAITPIDVDGQTYGSKKLYEFDEIEMPNGYTYFQYAGSELDMGFNGDYARGKNTSGVDYGGIDTAQKTVMFTTVNVNIHTVRVRVGCENQSSSTASRLRSLYFERFQYPFSIVLPNRTLLSFSGTEKNEKVELKGVLSASHTYDKIMIERSSNGSFFQHFAELPITNGGSAEFPFSYIDANPFEGNNFYRIRLVNSAQGLQEVSNTLMVKTGTDLQEKFTVYNSIVNLSDPSVTIQSMEETDAFFQVSDMSGRIVFSRKGKLNKGVNLVDLSNLKASTGYYVLVAHTSTDIIKHKMIIQ